MVKEYTKKLSIIVPVYNAEEYIEDCVNSLLKQDLSEQEYEIILINDGSTDNSPKLAQKLKEQNNNIVLLSQENKGQSVARNKGMDIAKGKYIMFVDADDKLYPNVIKKIVSVAEENLLDVCAYRIKYYDSGGKEIEGAIQPFPADKIYKGCFAVMNGADIGAVWLNLYSNSFINSHKLRFLEGIYHEDVDFNLRMYAFADRIMFTDIVGYSYNYNPNSSTREQSKEKYIKLIKDDICVVKHIRDFSTEHDINADLKDFYLRHGNSMLVSKLLMMLKSKFINSNEKKEIFNMMKSYNLYPIKGGTLSRKSSFLIQILNIEWLYKLLIS